MKRIHLLTALAIGYALGTARRSSAQLTRIERKLETMANDQEQQLDEALAEMKQSVNAATERVIKKLEAKDIDLSDEIGDIKGIQAAVNRIAADAPPATPEPSAATSPTEDTTES